MKRFPNLFILSLCLLAGALLINAATPPEKPAASNRLLGIELPTTVTALTERFGEPSAIDLPTEEDIEMTAVKGQWFRWNLEKKGGQLSALGDAESTAPVKTAEVRFVQLTGWDHGRSTDTIFGFEINRTFQSAVQEKLGPGLERCSGSYRDEPVFKYIDGNLYDFFFFNESGLLIGVAQSTFDMDTAG